MWMWAQFETIAGSTLSRHKNKPSALPEGFCRPCEATELERYRAGGNGGVGQPSRITMFLYLLTSAVSITHPRATAPTPS